MTIENEAVEAAAGSNFREDLKARTSRRAESNFDVATGRPLGPSMTIPDEAVKAAARAHQDLKVHLGHLGWDELNKSGQEWRLDHMRAALEAALPLLKGNE